MRVLFVSKLSIIWQSLAYLLLTVMVVLLWMMALPRLTASLEFLPVQQSQLQLYTSSGSDLDIPVMIDRSQRAIAYHEAYPYHATLSLLHYVQGTDTAASLFLRRSSLDESIEHARRALNGAPLQPDLWLRMAQAGVQNFLPAQELAAYFRMAILSGRVEPTHLIARLQIGFALQALLDEEGLNLLRDQVLLAWNLKQHEFSIAIRNRQLNRASVEALLSASHPDVLREMEATLGPATI